jgi:hypothetical protein
MGRHRPRHVGAPLPDALHTAVVAASERPDPAPHDVTLVA